MDDQTPDLRQTLGVLWRHKVLIAGVAIVGALGAYYLSAGQTPIYESSARIVLRPVVTSAAFGGFGNSDPLGLKLAPESEAEILTSPIIGQRVKDDLKLQDPAEVLAASIQVRILTDELILVSASAFTPARAAELANGFAEEYLAYRRELANDSLRAHINDLEQRTKAILKRVNALDKDIIKLSAQSGAIRANDELSSRDTARLAQYQAEIDRFTAERNELLGDLASLRSRHEDARASQLGTGGGGEVVQPAIEPVASVSPKPKRDALAGFMVGLILGIAVAFVRHHFDERIRTEQDVARAAGVPLLGVIPRLRTWRRRKDAKLVMLADAGSATAESFRSLRQSLTAMGVGRERKVVVVTSGGRGAGRTSTVANLGVAFGQAGYRVLMVSADLREPRLHEFFEASNDEGLSQALAEDRDPTSLVHPTVVPDVSLLASGPVPNNPAALLDGKRLAAVLEKLAASTDVLLIDVASLSSGADATVFASHADVTLLAMRHDRARAAGSAGAVEGLRRAGATSIGAVLTVIDDERSVRAPFASVPAMPVYLNGTSDNGHATVSLPSTAVDPAPSANGSSNGTATRTRAAAHRAPAKKRSTAKPSASDAKND